MTSCENTAELLVRVYLNGRSMPRVLQDAVVWVVASRLTRGEKPVLDEVLRSDIDHHAFALSDGVEVPAEQPELGALLRH